MSPATAGTAPLWITEAEVAALMTMPEAIDALTRGLLAEARGEASNMIKTHVAWGGGHTLHALGAVFPALGVAGTKTWTHTGRGATPLLILFDSTDGSLKAIIEAFTLGTLRSGAISGVATRWLAAAGANELALIGTGKQAASQVAAVAAVRRLRRVRVFSPTAAHRTACAARLRTQLDCEVTEAASVAAAVDGASIITLVTRATAPVLSAALVARGAHVNAVGAITPERVEFAADVLGRCDRVVADSVPAAQTLSREFIDYYGSAERDWSAVVPLSRVVAAQQPRPAAADLTLFKAMGMGISDLSLGMEVYDKAMRRRRAAE